MDRERQPRICRFISVGVGLAHSLPWWRWEVYGSWQHLNLRTFFCQVLISPVPLSPALLTPNLLPLEGHTAVRIKKKGRGWGGVCVNCFQILKWVLQISLCIFCFFNYLSLPTTTETGVGQQFIHLSLYFCRFLWLCAAPVVRNFGDRRSWQK